MLDLSFSSSAAHRPYKICGNAYPLFDKKLGLAASHNADFFHLIEGHATAFVFMQHLA
jgi:hypothetical protein